jgi:uncharacterized membrane protein
MLRGLAIIVMALDHTRDYFHSDAMIFAPLDLTRTTVPLFFTRWITHFCAPVFMFLTGTSAYLVAQRKTKKELSFFLLTRGLWLIFLGIDIHKFWVDFQYSFSVFCSGGHMGPRCKYDSIVVSSLFALSMILGSVFSFSWS